MMNLIKKILGFMWLLGGLILAAILIYKTVSKLILQHATAEDYVFWIVIVVIFIPIILGFMLFGYYSLKGEYSKD